MTWATSSESRSSVHSVAPVEAARTLMAKKARRLSKHSAAASNRFSVVDSSSTVWFLLWPCRICIIGEKAKTDFPPVSLACRTLSPASSAITIRTRVDVGAVGEKASWIKITSGRLLCAEPSHRQSALELPARYFDLRHRVQRRMRCSFAACIDGRERFTSPDMSHSIR